MGAPAGRHLLIGVVILVVVAAIVGGVIMLGPPSEERSRRLDQRRISDLRGIQAAVMFYRQKNRAMPASLQELRSDAALTISNDPVTGAPYGYRVLTGDTYEICGTFDRASVERVESGVDEWRHGVGRACFERTVRTQSPE